MDGGASEKGALKKTMQFRARVAQVTGAAPTTVDAPLKISVKLEPLEVPDAEWLFSHLGSAVLVELSTAPPLRTPIEDAIEEAYHRG
jgi:hypothetical protein